MRKSKSRAKIKSRSLMFAVSSLWIALILVILAVPGGIAAVRVRSHPQPSGHRLWDLTLSAEDGEENSLDLGQDNSRYPSAELYL